TDAVSAPRNTVLPVSGVYMYATRGSESASAPGLLASSAQYPVTTTVTVFSDGCGQDWRWQPLTNRYEDLVVCRSPDGSSSSSRGTTLSSSTAIRIAATSRAR